MSLVGLNTSNLNAPALLLPTVGIWTVPFTLYNAILSYRIVGIRIKTEKFTRNNLGDSTLAGSSDLQTAIACHENFLENVPLALILATTAELNGGRRKVLNYALGSLLLFRLLHSEAGLRLKGKFGDNGIGRPIGYFGSLGVLLFLGGYAASLVSGLYL